MAYFTSFSEASSESVLNWDDMLARVARQFVCRNLSWEQKYTKHVLNVNHIYTLLLKALQCNSVNIDSLSSVVCYDGLF